ncbi:hypothetical protein DCO58_00260 [Helicobacter saguini]|uniref:Uncharacterized protein n=1 Tax=Helicobacter saguini TaxID=1548018 RepID=A0A347VQS8_9HELI|nr:hypothetical protein [Helicobacter saguini]MWV63174.1 hypothetical protein [Helicobacter saguini]MWV66156.1 hypothetical protein [Helicobacter saguini]MWV68505.1 hypothetical protein [Helicobacter saguini]MWV71940.1 hypothetical protein [Helicobacter saguini]TLD95950.1 hypothetical protein LS64_000895 [Helicobacter saguini]
MSDNKDTKDSNNILKVKCDSADYELEVWKRLWASRDFELQHFWQRSIFLTAFLVLGFTAYGSFQGVFLGKFFENKIVLDSKEFVICNLISIFLCCVNAVLSMLWIMMTKGSKNAYEVYENALESILIPYALKRANVKLNSSNVSKSPCILKLNAYRYSVSKINIFLGVFSLFIFSLLGGFHFVLMLECSVNSIAIAAVVVFIVDFILFCFLKEKLTGGKN